MTGDPEQRARWVAPGAHKYRPGRMPPLFGDTAATLIVDDEELLADLLKQVLTPEGYDCTIANNAKDARLALEQREFAVALVDVMMPDESGLVLVTDMLEHHPNLAVVMVTGVDDPEIAKLAIDSGVYGYVIKPFTPSQLLITVANAGLRRCVEIQRDAYEHRLERLADGSTPGRPALVAEPPDAPDGRPDADGPLKGVAGEIAERLEAVANSAAYLRDAVGDLTTSGAGADGTEVRRAADAALRAAEDAVQLLNKVSPGRHR